MTVHDALAAVPTSASGDPVVKDLLHNLLIERYPYVFEGSEDPEAFDAVDEETGAIPVTLVFQGGLFTLDAADTTTAHDGVVCLVTNDGKRYKRETVDFDVKSVLDKDETDPPGDAELGDRYIVPAGASGDWGTHPKDIAVFTARGWVYIEPKIGLLIRVEDEAAYYHYDESGDWEPGIGQSALANNSVFANHVLGGRTHWVVVNQTTNAPPGSPATGDTYIVGGVPTGAWSGHTGKIAIYSGSTWLIFTPAEGWTAYDQALNAPYIYSGSGWGAQAGAVVDSNYIYHASPTVTQGGTGSYGPIDATNQPTTAQTYTQLEHFLTFAAPAGRRVDIRVRLVPTNSSLMAFGIFRDSESSAIDSKLLDIIGNREFETSFTFVTPDAFSHTYKFRSVSYTGVGTRLSTTNYRFLFEYKVFA